MKDGRINRWNYSWTKTDGRMDWVRHRVTDGRTEKGMDGWLDEQRLTDGCCTTPTDTEKDRWRDQRMIHG